jgi:hypothetical protein
MITILIERLRCQFESRMIQPSELYRHASGDPDSYAQLLRCHRGDVILPKVLLTLSHLKELLVTCAQNPSVDDQIW